jgi:hypothetical protein
VLSGGCQVLEAQPAVLGKPGSALRERQICLGLRLLKVFREGVRA